MKCKITCAVGLLLLGIGAVLFIGQHPLSCRIFAGSLWARYQSIINGHNQDLKKRIIAPGESLEIKVRPKVKSIQGRCALKKATFEVQGEALQRWTGQGDGADWGNLIKGKATSAKGVSVLVDIPRKAPTNKPLDGVLRATFVYPKRTERGKFINALKTVELPLTVCVFRTDQAKLLHNLRGKLIRIHILSLYGFFAAAMIALMVGFSYGTVTQTLIIVPMFLLSLISGGLSGGFITDALFGRWESTLESLAGIATFLALTVISFFFLMYIFWQFATKVLRWRPGTLNPKHSEGD